MLIALASGLQAMDEIQLFHYIHPAHSEQVAYIVNVAKYMMEKREWNRQFTVKEELCPVYSHEICPDGATCTPPGEPPKQPPNVCDKPEYALSPMCNPGGDCYDDGTCPIKVCDIPVNQRKAMGVDPRMCDPGDCVPQPGVELPEDCKPVTRCDLKIYAEHVSEEECNTPDPCKTNPDLCINICDVTNEYGPCGYLDCYKWPLPHCIELPPPPPCPVDSEYTESNNHCCIGLDCFTPFDRCLWGQNVGKRVVTTLSLDDFQDNSRLDDQGNPILDCVTEYTETEKQPLMFECFKDGILKEGFSLVSRADIDAIVEKHVQEGDKVLVTGSIDDENMRVDLTNDEKVVVQGARP